MPRAHFVVQMAHHKDVKLNQPIYIKGIDKLTLLKALWKRAGRLSTHTSGGVWNEKAASQWLTDGCQSRIVSGRMVPVDITGDYLHHAHSYDTANGTAGLCASIVDLMITPRNLYLAWDGAMKSAAGVSVNELKYAASTVRPPANTNTTGVAHKQLVVGMLNQFKPAAVVN